MIDITKQKMLHDTIAFSLLILVLFFLLFGLTFFTRSSWQNGLKAEVEKRIESTFPNQYTVGSFVKINSPLATSGASYALVEKAESNNQPDEVYAVIIRVTGLYGPIPLVFIYNATNKTGNYCGYAGFDDEIQDMNKYGISSVLINYWINRLPEIIPSNMAGE